MRTASIFLIERCYKNLGFFLAPADRVWNPASFDCCSADACLKGEGHPKS